MYTVYGESLNTHSTHPAEESVYDGGTINKPNQNRVIYEAVNIFNGNVLIMYGIYNGL